jgi:DDE family transposase
VVRGIVIRLEVEHLPRPTKPPQPLWFWWSGPHLPDLAEVWRAYTARFSIEHTFRFFKQTLGWTTPKLRAPAAADRWTWVLILAYVQLRLARDAVGDVRLPWQPALPLERRSPARVRRSFSHVLAQLGTPACAPKPCGRSPGRPSGKRSPPAPRFPAVKLTP